MKSKKGYFIILLLLPVMLFNCKKRTPSTEADGHVICIDDSTAIGGANVRIAHWDGSQNSDTNYVSSRLADSLGAFYQVFETEDVNHYYWARAEKQGYKNSSWEPLEGGFNNTVTITMSKVEN